MVLPAAEAHERPGTTTNIEGRVSRLGQKLVPPGQAWPDWMIAAELAVHLGADLGLDSVGDVWDEIERLAPAYRGITRAVLDAPGAADGVVAPLPASAGARSGARARCPARPDRHPRGRVGRAPGGAAPGRTGRVARPPGSASPAPSRAAPRATRSRRPGPASARPARSTSTSPTWPRSTATRCGWWPRASSTTAGRRWTRCRPWPAWWPPRPLRANPHDLDDLGVAAGRIGPAAHGSATSTGGDGGARPIAAPPGGGRRLQRPAAAEGTVADLIDAGAPGGRTCGWRPREPAGCRRCSPLLGAGDPLYANGVDWVVFLIVLIKVLVVFGALMVSVMLMIWFERKVISDMQSRIGPNRAGPFGIAQTLADGIKLFFKEDLLPDQADRFVFKLAPVPDHHPGLPQSSPSCPSAAR